MYPMYLGDGVYLDVWQQGGGIHLYTSDGVNITNEIFLDISVVLTLLSALKQMGVNAP